VSVVSNASPLISLARLGQLERVMPAVKPSLDALRNVAGFCLGDEVYARVLRDAGEASLSRPGLQGGAGARSPRWRNNARRERATIAPAYGDGARTDGHTRIAG
jgi:hypothetical protein